ncbi:hypothetical protein V6N12_066796 [Hibiscus sabdariffa]|uniref:Prolyl 4-hydroxylase alpha subunit domain-containing protein n=1 Tax=Hibiscus sabdariffa TaxID=183260 RepID=A0ABR2C960_9ROSI
MAPAMKIVLGLLTFVTLGALLQLAFIRNLEDSYGNYQFPNTKFHTSRHDGYLKLPIGMGHWRGDKEAEILRLGYVKPEIISWSPRIIVLHNFLSYEECDYLRAIALPRLQVSTVVDAKTGMGVKSKVRTSSGMFLKPSETVYPMIQHRYERDQFYKPHHDYFSDRFNVMRGQRIATMLMYLSDDVEGGETYFPKAGTGVCSCGGKIVKGLSIKPIKGDAVLFWSMFSLFTNSGQFFRFSLCWTYLFLLQLVEPTDPVQFLITA